MLKKFYYSILLKLRELFLKHERKKIKIKKFSILSNNCIGGLFYNKYGLEFNSPTINTWFDNDLDFFIFINNLNSYLNGSLENVSMCDDGAGHIYPQGFLSSDKENLKKIHLSFVHYNSPKEAIDKWNIRKNRIIFEKIVVVIDLSYPPYPRENLDICIEEFKKIKFPKILFLRNENRGLANCYSFELPDNARAASHQKMTKIKTYLDQFDFAGFINEVFTR